MFQHISVELHNHHTTIWLDRQDTRNAFTERMANELTQAFDGIPAHHRAVILAAKGSTFCSGVDLEWMSQLMTRSPEENHQEALSLATMLHSIDRCPIPIIARIQGDCLGIGMGLVAISDLAYATPQVTFCLSENRLGLIPSLVAPYVVRAIGYRQAQRYFLTSETILVTQAIEMGLIHQVSASDQLDDILDGLIIQLSKLAPQAIQDSKALLKQIVYQPIDKQLINETAKLTASVRSSAEALEGVTAFLEKRPPSWVRISTRT